MTYQVLARKWRPRDFPSLVGQEHVVRALTHALDQQRLHHAYLFTGTRGVGKTTLSRILAKAFNCETGITSQPCGVCRACREIDAGRFVDYVEMDAASNRGVDEMAALLERAIYAPVDARFKVYMIDEVHMLTNHAFNAMLKTLEEPPAHVKFILATTDPQKIPVTVLSRCLQFNLKQMPAGEIVSHLDKVLTAEGIGFEPQALRLLSRAADGSMRDALSLTDQAIAYSAGPINEEAVRGMLGALDQHYLMRLLDGIVAGDGPAVLGVADEMALRSLSFSVALQDLAQLLNRIGWAQFAPTSVLDEWPEAAEIRRFAQLLTPEQVQLYYQIATIGRSELGLAPDEYAGFSMTLLRMLAFRPLAGGEPSKIAPLAAPASSAPPKIPSAPKVAAVAAPPKIPSTPPVPDTVAPPKISSASQVLAATAPAWDEPATPVATASAPAIVPAPTLPVVPNTSIPSPASVDSTPSSSLPASAAPMSASPAPIPAGVASPSAAPGTGAGPMHVAPRIQAVSQDLPAAAPPPRGSSPARAALEALGALRSGASASRAVPQRPTPAPRNQGASPSAGPNGSPSAASNPTSSVVSGAVSGGSGVSGAPVAPVRAADTARSRPDGAMSAPPRPNAGAAGAGRANGFSDPSDANETSDDAPPWEAAPWDDDGADAFLSSARASGRPSVNAASVSAFAQRNDNSLPPADAPGLSADAPPAPPLPPGLSLAVLGFEGDWPALAAELDVKGLAQQLAYQSEAVAADAASLSLRIPMAHLAAGAHVDKVTAALAERLRPGIELRIEVGPVVRTAAALEAARKAEQQRRAEQSIRTDPFVQALLRDFGASILPGSTQPLPQKNDIESRSR